jgi:Fic family protein
METKGPIHYHLGKFPPQNIDWKRLIPLIGPTSASLARYDGLLAAIPNAHVLLSPMVTQEAVLSSKIEGTQVTIGEVLEIEAGRASESLTKPKRDDAEEVFNYRKALRACEQALQSRPISQHLIRSAHEILMQGVRGKDKTPGAYRTEQNWIGPTGCTLENAGFIPVSPDHLQTGLDEWERYSRSEAEPDALVQLSLLHLEFEALHPFKDGNGRLGRMLIPLFLFQRKLLSSPDFYMSQYLELNREEYQGRLRAVSSDGKWTEWCIFFLNGIKEQAGENEKKARSILALYERIKEKLPDMTHSQHASRALDFIFQYPIFPTPNLIQKSGIPKPTANRILKILRENDMVIPLQEGKGRRSGIYAFRELINITEGKNIL